MSLKRQIFGYSKKDVDGIISDYEALIDLQRKDIEYLKKDNNLLKLTISEIEKNKK